MTFKMRRKLFYALVAAFFVLGGALTFYASGWRLDFATFRIRKVGAIFVRTFPKGVNLRLDGVPTDNNPGIFQNGTLINNLFPKNYNLEVEANGYAPWHEHVSVAPALVSEENAVLIPLFPATIASGTIKNFWLFGNDVVVEGSRGNLTIAGKSIGTGDVLGTTGDFETILTRDTARGIYLWNDTANRTSVNVSALLTQAGITNKAAVIVVDKNDKQNLIVLEPKNLSLLNTKNGTTITLRTLIRNTIVNAAASQFLIAWTEFNSTANTSTLVLYDKFSGRRRPMTIDLPAKNAELRWIQNDKLAVFQENGTLYTYDPSKNNLTKVADDVKRFAFTENGSALAALEHTALEVFFFTDDKDYYRFNLSQVKDAVDVLWYADEKHLFVLYPDEIRLLDLRDSSLENFGVVAESNRVQYDAENNWFYFLGDEGIQRLDFAK
jgi:hypothetical protein